MERKSRKSEPTMSHFITIQYITSDPCNLLSEMMTTKPININYSEGL